MRPLMSVHSLHCADSPLAKVLSLQPPKVCDSHLPVYLLKPITHTQCRNQALHRTWFFKGTPLDLWYLSPALFYHILQQAKERDKPTSLLSPPPTKVYPSWGRKKVWEQQTGKNGAVKNQRSHRQLCQLASHRPQRGKWDWNCSMGLLSPEETSVSPTGVVIAEPWPWSRAWCWWWLLMKPALSRLRGVAHVECIWHVVLRQSQVTLKSDAKWVPRGLEEHLYLFYFISFYLNVWPADIERRKKKIFYSNFSVRAQLFLQVQVHSISLYVELVKVGGFFFSGLMHVESKHTNQKTWQLHYLALSTSMQLQSAHI